jgi:hypothetical protein
LRDRFESEIGEKVDDFVFNGDREKRLPHISNISFRASKAKAFNQSRFAGHRRFDRLGVFFGQSRTVAGHPRARQRRRTGARRDPFQFRQRKHD